MCADEVGEVLQSSICQNCKHGDVGVGDVCCLFGLAFTKTWPSSESIVTRGLYNRTWRRVCVSIAKGVYWVNQSVMCDSGAAVYGFRRSVADQIRAAAQTTVEPRAIGTF